MPIQDIVALHAVVLNLAAKCYPDRIDYVDKVLEITENIFNNMNLDQLSIKLKFNHSLLLV